MEKGRGPATSRGRAGDKLGAVHARACTYVQAGRGGGMEGRSIEDGAAVARARAHPPGRRQRRRGQGEAGAAQWPAAAEARAGQGRRKGAA